MAVRPAFCGWRPQYTTRDVAVALHGGSHNRIIPCATKLLVRPQTLLYRRQPLWGGLEHTPCGGLRGEKSARKPINALKDVQETASTTTWTPWTMLQRPHGASNQRNAEVRDHTSFR